MNDKELWEKVSKLTLDNIQVVNSYVDFLLETKAQKDDEEQVADKKEDPESEKNNK